MSSGGGADPWAWLGLLKWSLSYSDGTSNTKATPMSDEDKAFLEQVMKEGIIDENERMKFILKQLTDAVEFYQHEQSSSQPASDSKEPPIEDNDLEELLLELRDIVEQIDYARAFMSIKGLPFLLGCIEERQAVPRPIRSACLGLIATLCQNNSPVQKELLELGALKVLSDLYFSEDPATSLSSKEQGNDEENIDSKSNINTNAMKPKYMQALSSIVRSHELAENVLDNLEQTVALFVDGLNPSTATDGLKRRALFFLRAYVTSDSATAERVRKLAAPIGIVADYYLEESTVTPAELREMSLSLLQQILEQKKSVDVILQRKTALVGLGVQRIAAMRKLTGDDKEYATVELEAWEGLIQQLARANPDEAEPAAGR
eukprot:CAMPEP_0119565474 /NCGR_PEP_ID=MMETSP1352-20130426/30144_1 /TAXON_ID=265584 /ORGANISM="Stauroneis constricta, Strain CCMP1120" /LENGTH=374 /DNA_ID=CAMNT_0007614395 /DNA_START=101 /DNA_END=1225 /DNA_ORIENTATION=-